MLLITLGNNEWAFVSSTKTDEKILQMQHDKLLKTFAYGDCKKYAENSSGPLANVLKSLITDGKIPETAKFTQVTEFTL